MRANSTIGGVVDGCARDSRTAAWVYAGRLMATLDSEVAPIQTVDLRGYRMAYREWGDPAATDALILIHGITSSSLSWIRVAPRLAARRRVIAVDLKGHGDSDRPPTGYRIADQVNEITGLHGALGLGEVSVMGHSWGGGIALQLAASGTLPIRRLVLEDPAVGQRHPRPEQTATREQMAQFYMNSVGLTHEEAEVLARPNLANGWTEQDVAGKIDAAMKGSRASVERVFVENGRWDLLDNFAGLRCPTLLIRAEVARGGIVDEEAVAAATASPLVKVVTVPTADHNIHRGRFDAFMAEVEPFLAGPGT
jgi:pimeloyl-ACP methyl ester carboxylesterase